MGGAMGGIDNALGTDMSGNRARDRATGAQTSATDKANQFLTNTFATQQNYLNPYSAVGQPALQQLASGNIMDGYKASDAYKFQLGEGQNAINNGMAARGLGNSGAAMKALTKYSQGLASQDAQQYYNNEMGRLNGLAGMGFQAANNLANNTGAHGSSISNNYTGLGNAVAAANIAQSSNNAQMMNGLFQAGGALGGAYLGGAAVASDRRVKKNIEELTPEEIKQVGKILKAYRYQYLKDEFGEGEWIGVMAQDLEKDPIGKLLVSENEQGIKVIDLKKVLSMFLAYSFSEAA